MRYSLKIKHAGLQGSSIKLEIYCNSIIMISVYTKVNVNSPKGKWKKKKFLG